MLCMKHIFQVQWLYFVNVWWVIYNGFDHKSKSVNESTNEIQYKYIWLKSRPPSLEGSHILVHVFPLMSNSPSSQEHSNPGSVFSHCCSHTSVSSSHSLMSLRYEIYFHINITNKALKHEIHNMVHSVQFYPFYDSRLWLFKDLE